MGAKLSKSENLQTSMNTVAFRTRSWLRKKECNICRNNLRTSSFMSTPGCDHKYCTYCCKRYVEVKFKTGDSHIQCPHEDCLQTYSAHQCQKMLSKENYSVLTKRRQEAAIPAERRFYCPHEDCLAFMRKPESGTFLECVSCHRRLCVECNVAWHEKKTCSEWRAELENSRLSADQKFQDLAKEKRWQTCSGCKRVVERTSGCNYMVCRCRNAFCYACGGKKPLCKC